MELDLVYKFAAVYVLIGLCVTLAGGGWRPHDGSRLLGIIAGIVGTFAWLPTIVGLALFARETK